MIRRLLFGIVVLTMIWFAVEGGEFALPVRLAPVRAVEMAAAMAGDLMPFGSREPDLVEARRDFGLALREADIGFSGGSLPSVLMAFFARANSFRQPRFPSATVVMTRKKPWASSRQC